MTPSVEQQIESIVGSLEEQGQRAAPVAATLALADSHPEAVYDLANAVMQRFPKGGTFLDAALSFLPAKLWPEIVERAIETLEVGDGENEAADSIIAYASLQQPAALHPHLTRIFAARPNGGAYYESYPWRESGEQHFAFLRSIVETSDSDDDRLRAWEAMIETRQPSAVEFAISNASRVRPVDHHLEADEWLSCHLQLVGYDDRNGTLSRTCSDQLFHIQFPESYFEDESRPPWLERAHPTWKLPSCGQSVPFGGVSAGECLRCEKTLHRLIVLDPVPPSLVITAIPRVELAVCLSCLGWEEPRLFYRHDEQGRPSHSFYTGSAADPQFPVGPLKPTSAELAPTPPRWYWQDWALSNSRENLNRIGGEPCWIQGAEYPECPACQRTMSFLMQLDSDLPTADGDEWLWGSGGICYGFWCDLCRVSGFLWQCT